MVDHELWAWLLKPTQQVIRSGTLHPFLDVQSPMARPPMCTSSNKNGDDVYKYMGVSENSVPLNPMVNDHYPY